MISRFAVLCESTSVDAESNRVSLFNVIEGLTLGVDPDAETEEGADLMLPFSGTLVVTTERTNPSDPEAANGRIVLRVPDGREFRGVTFDTDLSNHLRARSTFQIDVLPFAGAGVYQFKLQYEDDSTGKWETINTVSLPVEVETEST